MTILHVEDETSLAQLVRAVFESFGFQGEILHASRLTEAFALLDERERKKAPLDLILVDMQLQDGIGLEVLRKVKASPTWYKTPVIVLSGETDPGLINEAYSLGANCYLPKLGRKKGALGPVQALYQCWIEGALLPQASFADQAQEALARGVRLRARVARFYLGLAKAYAADAEQEKFWIERSLIEGNKSNLLAFFQGQISDSDVPPGVAEQAIDMQRKIEQTLKRVEPLLALRPPLVPAETYRWVLDLVEAWDEEAIAEVFGALFPKSPTVTRALKAQSVGQLRELAGHILKQSQEPELRQRAESLLAFAGRLSAF